MVAVHEAAHAIAAHVAGYGVTEARCYVAEDGHVVGGVLYRDGGSSFARAVAHLAGGAAVRLLVPRWPNDGTGDGDEGTDLAHARANLATVGRTLAEAREAASALVAAHRAAIMHVAALLFAEGYVDGERVAESSGR